MEKKAKVIKANYRLQHKVGAGPLDEGILEKSQNVIDSNTVDFVPVGLATLKKLEGALDRVNDPALTMQDIRTMLIKPVMELKGSATTFHYTLVGKLASTMLGFLETIMVLDQDAFDIVKAHHKTLYTITVRRIKGDGGPEGDLLQAELKQACERYYKKKL